MKKIVTVLSIPLVLVGCGGKTVPFEKKYSEQGYTRQEIGSGSNKRSEYKGKGSKIGIIENQFTYTDWDQIKGRFTYGKKVATDNAGKTTVTDLKEPTNKADRDYQQQKARHSDMVTYTALGKDHGIAKEAEGVMYQVVGPRLGFYEGKTDITGIYDHAKANNLVAISNSWGTLPDASYAGVSSARAKILANARFSLRYNGKDRKNARLGMVLCPDVKTAYESGEALSTDVNIIDSSKAADWQTLTSAEVKGLYEIECKGGYDSKVTEAVYKNHFGSDFIERIKTDAKNGEKNVPIWVWAAGNRDDENPVFAGSLPGAVSEAEQYWISVVAIDNEDGNTYKRGWYSGHCGQARKYCIGAVSDGGKHLLQDGTETANRGTSAAAPVISGGMAVIKSAFSSKNNVWVRNRLLQTARHVTADGKPLLTTDGTPVVLDADGLSDEFGHGIMRLDLALNPYGQQSLSVSGLDLSDSQKFDVRNSFVQSSSVFGDGLRLGFGQVDSLKFDSMGAEFAYNMGDSVRTMATATKSTFFDFDKQAYTPQSYAVLNSNLSFMDTGGKRFENFDYTESTMPFVSTGGHPMQIAYRHSDTMSFMSRFSPEKTVGNSAITAQVSYKHPSQDSTLNIGIHTEQGTVLGASFKGAYGGIGRAHTAYINRVKSIQNKGWDIRYSATASATSSNGIGGSSVQGIRGLIASSFSAVAHRVTTTGTLGLAVYQPLRLERGQMDVTFVKGVSDNTKLSYDSKTVNLSPSGRQVSVEAYYDFANSPWTIKANLSQDHGHVKGRNDGTVLVKWFKPFR